MPQLIISSEAEADLVDAKDWYDQQREGLGEQFILCIEAALDRLQNNPEAASEVYPGVRRMIVRQFPYGVYFLVVRERITVVAVYHSKRDPRGWRSRA